MRFIRTGIVLLVTGLAGIGVSIWWGNYDSIAVNLGSGPISTNYGQASALCGGPFGQKAIAASNAVANSCHIVGNVSGVITTIVVFAVLATIIGIAGIILGLLNVFDPM